MRKIIFILGLTLLLVTASCSEEDQTPFEREVVDNSDKINIGKLHLIRGISAPLRELNNTVSLGDCATCKEIQNYGFMIESNTTKMQIIPRCSEKDVVFKSDLSNNESVLVPDIYGNLSNRKYAARFHIENNTRKIRVIISGPTKISVNATKQEGVATFVEPGKNYWINFDLSKINFKEFTCSVKVVDDINRTVIKTFHLNDKGLKNE